MLRRTSFVGVAILCFGLMLLPGCTRSTPKEKSGLSVVCTTGMVSDMVKSIGGTHVEVIGLMGPGVDPHLYSAVPADIERLSAADMIFYNGLHLEGRMADLFERLANRKPTVAVTASLVNAEDPRLRKPPEFEGYYDPHVWHNPKLWAECVKHTADELIEADPSHRDEYIRNRDDYLQELDEADRYCREQLGTIPEAQRVLMTAHDAFNYFCHEYGLTSMPLKGVSTEDEVSIERMDEVVDYLVKHKIKAVFVESATPAKLVQSIVDGCKAHGHDVRLGPAEGKTFVLYADALGPTGSGADNYLGMIKTNVDTIVTALK
jgi:manganese/zinc/iron transport system substrate-binding protein